ncbi:MAG: ATP-dependent zinc metalloprotease FtsH [Synechococcales cyanobacterium C42_A2020_086]|jgi:cell division protease FtsH|nr:ATP-dependent zinc metalloprotease FtsH [Synechococcales cyanobacterium M58_A2018_015]MBF2073633.1 ATP-dependent zinc metalloprotease FtsH [Synechococcales cyanobacterium C42_A2020_086]
MPIEPPKNRDKRDKASEPRKFGSSLLSFLITLFLLNFVLLPALRPGPTRVLYSEFLRQVREGKVDQVAISDTEIRFTLRTDASAPSEAAPSPEASPGPQESAPSATEPSPEASPGGLFRRRQPDPEPVFSTVPIDGNTENLVTLLEEQNVEFGAVPPNQGGFLSTLLGWIIPPLIFVGIWAWFLQRAQGGSTALTVGKSKARIYAEGNTGVTFDDVAGEDEAKAELEEIVEFLKQPDKYTKLGAVIPKGVLLVGPPGTGKTLLAKAIAGEAGVPFFSISGSEFIELFVGVGAARVRDLFQQAKQKAPCIVFIDELDALGKARSSSNALGSNDEQEQTLNQLLTEMDGFEGNTGVIIIAATNRPEVLDPALRRPGRFDRQVTVDRPDKLGRDAILRVHAKKVQLAEDVDLSAIATRTPGFSGADLANLINEAALLAARKNQSAVRMADLNEAIERVIAGLERKSRVLNPLERKIVSYHEVGHAIVGFLMPGSNRVEKISIVPRGVGALGYTLQLPEEDRFLMAEDELRGRIATLLGGRSAEEVVFGKISTGASDDIQKATDLAERMVTIYGMDDQLGPVAFERVQPQFLNPNSARRPISPELTALIDRRVQQIMDAAHAVAQSILRTNRDLLEEVAQELLQTEVLEGDKLQQYLQRAQAPAELSEWLRSGQLNNGADDRGQPARDWQPFPEEA